MAAAKALELAADLSPDDRSRAIRLAAASRCASVAGADEHAVALARRALILIDEPQYTAELRSVIGLAEMRGGRPLDGLPTLVDAARDVAPSDPAKAFELLMWASWAAMWSRDVGVQVQAARLAATFAPPGGDEQSTFVANLLAGFAAMTQGDFAEGARLLEPALEWGATADASLHVFQASMGAFWLGDDGRVDRPTESYRGARS